MRICSLSALAVAFVAGLAGQQAPFIAVTQPDAPKGPGFLFQDSRGRLWVGGSDPVSEGLHYFDGSRFIAPVTDFPAAIVTGMAEDEDHGIWIASSSGVYRLFGGRLDKVVAGYAAFGIVSVSPAVMLTTVATPGKDPTRDGDLVRISRIEGIWRAETISSSSQDYRVRFRVDRSGSALYPCRSSFCELRRDDVVSWHAGSNLAVVHHPVKVKPEGGVVMRDSHGCIWIRGSSDATYQCPGDVQPTVLPTRVASVGASTILEMDDGNVAIGSASSLAIGRPGTFRVWSAENGYPSVAYAVAAKDGCIWLSSAKGLFVFSPRLQTEFWTERDGLGGSTWSVLHSGPNVFAIAGNALRRLDSDRSRWLSFSDVGNAMHLSTGPSDSLLVASATEGIVQIGRGGKVLRRSNPVALGMVESAADGTIWAAGMTGISRVEVGSDRLRLEPEPLPGQRGAAFDLQRDSQGNLWSCDGGGLIRKERRGWRRVLSRPDLLQDPCVSLAIDSSTNSAWYSYVTTAAFTFIGNPGGPRRTVQHFPSGMEVGNAVTYFFHADRRGWLWRGTEDGIYVADYAQARSGQWLHLDHGDGLPSDDINRRSFFEDKDGSVWFGAGTTVSHILPSEELVHPRYTPSVFVSGFSWNGVAFRMSDVARDIDHDADVVAHIGSLQFDRRNALRFRYRLLPEETGWMTSRGPDIALGRLPWGPHTLEVQARLYTGPWSATAGQSFTVLRPVWLSIPFLLSFAAAGGFGATVACRLRARQWQRQELVLPSLADWRLSVLSPEFSSLEGTLLDQRFKVGQIIARGGFATVFRGFDMRQNVPCAVKIFRRELSEKSWMALRFEQEVSALQKIRHPNVVSIYGHGRIPDGGPYLAMEYVDGKTLRDVLDETRLQLNQVAHWLRQCGDALSEIHTHGIRHRDVKPENLMIRSVAAATEELVLIDFSIAIVKDADETVHGLTRAAGTIQYMAPEQAIGYADESSDIYSLAKVLLEMLTGQRLSDLLPEAAMDLPSRVRELLLTSAFGLSQHSIDLISQALEFDPIRRPRNAETFARQVAGDLEGRA